MDWPPGSHASTFGGNPISCVAALKTIELLEGGLVENAERVGLHFLERLSELQKKYECIGDVRGLGLMVALEIVEDSASKKPCIDLRNKIIQKCFKKGLLLLGAGKSVLRFMPPLVVTQDDVDVAIEILDDTIQEILNK
jgi:4-aminobutyrate aminotransferase